jgi:ATP-dependent protease HslVU (ClpYQ) peptidase subunit
MTTLVVVRKNHEVAIAADSLTTFGDTRLPAQFDSTYDKIVHHKSTYIGLCGSAAHQLVFESLLAKHEDFDFSTKRAIFETFRKLHPILKEQHFLNPKEEEDDPYESTQITALIATLATLSLFRGVAEGLTRGAVRAPLRPTDAAPAGPFARKPRPMAANVA